MRDAVHSVNQRKLKITARCAIERFVGRSAYISVTSSAGLLLLPAPRLIGCVLPCCSSASAGPAHSAQSSRHQRPRHLQHCLRRSIAKSRRRRSRLRPKATQHQHQQQPVLHLCQQQHQRLQHLRRPPQPARSLVGRASRVTLTIGHVEPFANLRKRPTIASEQPASSSLALESSGSHLPCSQVLQVQDLHVL